MPGKFAGKCFARETNAGVRHGWRFFTGMRYYPAPLQIKEAQMASMAEGARQKGLMVVELPLDKIDLTYLTRDRMVVEGEEMQALIQSIRQRGQQTPIR